jgi:hypothetical protein
LLTLYFTLINISIEFAINFYLLSLPYFVFHVNLIYLPIYSFFYSYTAFTCYILNDDFSLQILTEISQKEETVNGITPSIFQKYLFPHHPELADRLFSHLHASSKVTTTYLGQSVFKQQAEKFLAIMNDQTVLENYVKMFSENKEESEITPDGLRELLMVSYRLAMSGNRGDSCAQILNTVSAVVSACVSITMKQKFKYNKYYYQILMLFNTHFKNFSFMAKILYQSVLLVIGCGKIVSVLFMECTNMSYIS